MDRIQPKTKQNITVSSMIDLLVEKYKNQESFNGSVYKSSSNNAKEYQTLKRSLSNYVEAEYAKSFTFYYFKNITSEFVVSYVRYLEEQGAKAGHKVHISGKLKKLQAVFNHGKKMGYPNIDLTVFDVVRDKMKTLKTSEPKAISHNYIENIENLDRSRFSKTENMHIDLFLFSFYTGGMTRTDIAYLTKDNINGNNIVYEKASNETEICIPLTSVAQEIIDRYKGRCFSHFLLPVLSPKYEVGQDQKDRTRRFFDQVNRTLIKVTNEIGHSSRITWTSARKAFVSKMLHLGYHPREIVRYTGNINDVININITPDIPVWEII